MTPIPLPAGTAPELIRQHLEERTTLREEWRPGEPVGFPTLLTDRIKFDVTAWANEYARDYGGNAELAADCVLPEQIDSCLDEYERALLVRYERTAIHLNGALVAEYTVSKR